MQKDVENDVSLSAKARESLLESITINDATLEDLSLDFTLPGYDIELIVSTFTDLFDCR